MGKDKLGYLVLSWAPQDPTIPHLVKKSTTSIGIDLLTIRISEGRSEDVRWLIRFGQDARDDDRAEKLGDALHCLFATTHSIPMERILLYPVPLSLIRDGILPRKQLEEFDESRDKEPIGILTLLDRAGIPASAETYIWACLPACEEERILRALAFLAESFRAVEFDHGMPMHWPPMRLGMAPTSIVELTRLETALQAAHKAAEAIVGEPRKDEKRFWWMLKSLGFTPDEMVGFEIKAPLRKKIKEMTAARDGRAAHGSHARTWPLTWRELRDWQACAKHLVYSSLMFKLPELTAWLKERNRRRDDIDTPPPSR